MTMVERVARAIEAAEQVNLPGEYTRIARATIEAMREPTWQMVRQHADPKAARYIWQAMIDAALHE